MSPNFVSAQPVCHARTRLAQLDWLQKSAAEFMELWSASFEVPDGRIHKVEIWALGFKLEEEQEQARNWLLAAANIKRI